MQMHSYQVSDSIFGVSGHSYLPDILLNPQIVWLAWEDEHASSIQHFHHYGTTENKQRAILESTNNLVWFDLNPLGQNSFFKRSLMGCLSLNKPAIRKGNPVFLLHRMDVCKS